MQAIVAVDQNWAIGNKDQLLVSIPEDHKFFRQMTTGKTVVLGRKTLITFPNGKPLKNRQNVILSRDPSYMVEGALTACSVDDLIAKVGSSDDIMIIGGGSIYQQFINYCNTVYVTKIDHSFEADTYFPNLDELPGWTISETSDLKEYEGIPYQFVKYVKS